MRFRLANISEKATIEFFSQDIVLNSPFTVIYDHRLRRIELFLSTTYTLASNIWGTPRENRVDRPSFDTKFQENEKHVQERELSLYLGF
jgi:hypothetical protein